MAHSGARSGTPEGSPSGRHLGWRGEHRHGSRRLWLERLYTSRTARVIARELRGLGERMPNLRRQERHPDGV